MQLSELIQALQQMLDEFGDTEAEFVCSIDYPAEAEPGTWETFRLHVAEVHGQEIFLR